MRLLLFDIDGTLVRCGPQIGPIFMGALKRTFGRTGNVRAYDFGGRTDTEAVIDLMTDAGLPRDEVEGRLGEVRSHYGDLLDRLDPEQMRLLPGVVELLEELAGAEDTCVALLTGNWEIGARAKLEPFGLNRFFEFGAFGEDGVRRNELVPVAVDRATARLGTTPEPSDVVIIGDTVRDIACGDAHGVPVLAVATGFTPDHRLEEAGARWVVPDLRHASVREILLDGHGTSRPTP
jgi:phosphoglycolate phosphatase-like HAD superfamily hydrolase